MLRWLKTCVTNLICGLEFASTISELHSATVDEFAILSIDAQLYLIHITSGLGISVRPLGKLITREDGKYRVRDEPSTFTPTQFRLLQNVFLAQYLSLLDS